MNTFKLILVSFLMIFWKIPVAYAKDHTIIHTQHIDYNNTDLKCLTENIYYEAKGQPIEGQIAVAQVTLNRLHHPKFAKSICGIINQKNQFSWAHTKNKHINKKQWNQSSEIAIKVLEGLRLANFDHALFYHNTRAKPTWRKMAFLTKIGDQMFYSLA